MTPFYLFQLTQYLHHPIFWMSVVGGIPLSVWGAGITE